MPRSGRAGCSGGAPVARAGRGSRLQSLLYLINRYYDPATGQFTSVDPDVSQTLAPYNYAGGDPVNSTDPADLLYFTNGVGISGTGRISNAARNPYFNEPPPPPPPPPPPRPARDPRPRPKSHCDILCWAHAAIDLMGDVPGLKSAAKTLRDIRTAIAKPSNQVLIAAAAGLDDGAETCTFFQTSIAFRPTLQAQHDDAITRHQDHRGQLFAALLARVDQDAS